MQKHMHFLRAERKTTDSLQS